MEAISQLPPPEVGGSEDELMRRISSLKYLPHCPGENVLFPFVGKRLNSLFIFRENSGCRFLANRTIGQDGWML